MVQCAECNHHFFSPGHTATTKSASDLLSEHALKKTSLSQVKSSKSSPALLQPQNNKGPNGVSKKTAPVLASEAEFELFAPDVIVRSTKVDSREEAANTILLDSKLLAPKASSPVVIGSEEEKAVVTNCPTVSRTRNGTDADEVSRDNRNTTLVDEVSRDNRNTTLRDIPSRLGRVASSSGSLQTSATARPASQALSLAKVKKFLYYIDHCLLEVSKNPSC